MQLSARKPTRLFVRFLSTGIALTITACSTQSIKPEGSSPLVVASCPPLQRIDDPSFAATAQALIDTSAQYMKCREAALGR
jgi:hypothetical protein